MPLYKSLSAVALVTACASLIACKAGYNHIYENSDPDDDAVVRCSGSPITSDPTEKTLALYDAISDLSCIIDDDEEAFYIVGQSVGNGDEIVSDDSFRNYATLIGSLDRRIAIASVDYEKSQRYSESELKDANDKLIEHAGDGGIVSITWTPLNPWTADNNDIDDKLAWSNNTDLPELYNAPEEGEESKAYQDFDSQITLVVEMLAELANQNVPVLFAPFPEMNTSAVWYGAQTNADADNTNTEVKFKALWDRLASAIEAQDLKNILWVYAPSTGIASNRVTATWGYPGSSNTDIVAPVAYTDEVSISDYSTYVDMNKPLGMTRLAPRPLGDGNFDNRNYITQLDASYPAIAYWIAEHDDRESNDLRSIASNEFANELLRDKRTATIETIKNEEWLKLD
ncbi:MAG TPA: glycosyl hydrolase [Marinagarivorans sp.]